MVSIHEERRVALNITGAEPLRIGTTSGRFQPSGLIITYSRAPQLPTNQWVLLSAKAHGKRLKPGGDLLTTDASHTWWSGDKKPEWVIEFIGRYHPTS
jgi:hypothetical protein